MKRLVVYLEERDLVRLRKAAGAGWRSEFVRAAVRRRLDDVGLGDVRPEPDERQLSIPIFEPIRSDAGAVGNTRPANVTSDLGGG